MDDIGPAGTGIVNVHLEVAPDFLLEPPVEGPTGDLRLPFINHDPSAPYTKTNQLTPQVVLMFKRSLEHQQLEAWGTFSAPQGPRDHQMALDPEFYLLRMRGHLRLPNPTF